MNTSAVPIIDKMFTDLAEASRDIIYLADKKGNILYSNQSNKILLGYEHDELLQQPSSAIIHKNNLDDLSNDVRQITSDRLSPVRKIKLRKKDNTWFSGEIQCFLVSSEHSNFIGAIIYDTSKYREETVQKQNDKQQCDRKCTIMVMDDETMLRDMMKPFIESMGHNVIVTENGEQTIETYRNLLQRGTPVDLVIMDLTNPDGMGGKETAEKLLQKYPDACLIISSGYSDDRVMANYEQYGFKAALSKPFLLETAKRTISSVLQTCH